MRRHRRLAVWVLLVCSAHGLAATLGSASEKVTLYRDVWGVPHVYADTAPAGAYGLGYAQAEDRLDDIYLAVRTGIGRLSEVTSESYVDQDYIMQLVGNAEQAKAYYKTAPENLRLLGDAFCDGIKAYIADNPESANSPYAIDLEPWHFLTVGRAMILRWPMGTIQDDMKNRAENPKTVPPMQSNQWVVGPERSADGRAILLSDPHLTWEGLAVLYEARVHAGDLHMCGYFLIGTPLVGIGHNQHVGWANTTGGPDTADVYEMKVRTNGILPQYEYDGEWRNGSIKLIRVPVKDKKPVMRPGLLTHLGPMIAPPDDGVAYVAATPYFDAMGLFDQFYRMNMARNVRELYEALGMNEYNEQNMMFADTTGNIGYVRVGRVPIRPDGYNWRAPVPGHTSATAWKGIHPIDDLVQVFNPPQGYMQNCNIKPEMMMEDSPLTSDKYPDYIYNGLWWEDNPRGRRTLDLLKAHPKLTRDQAEQIAFDIYDNLAPVWQTALRKALDADAVRAQSSAAPAAKSLLAWDGTLELDKTPTVVYRLWRQKCLDDKLSPEDFAAENLAKLWDRFAQAVDETSQRYGRWDIPWGEVYRVGRAGKLFPVSGADFGPRAEPLHYTETLFNVAYREDPDKPGLYIARTGSMALILMLFGPDGIESYTCVAWGQSGNPDSPHFVDQAEKLYSPRKFKPTFWKKQDLLANLSSEKTLTVRAAADHTETAVPSATP